MGFFKRLFGGKEKKYVDTQGIYFYVACENCGAQVRVRADKQHDLNREDGGFVWHKTIVDSRCFRRMQAVVHLDQQYNMTEYELTGGRFISEGAYQAGQTAAASQPADDDAADE